jgi:hypothetical protein
LNPKRSVDALIAFIGAKEEKPNGSE